jgi:hypothetical protein
MKRERGIEVGEESVEEITEPGRDFDYILNMPIFSFTKERKEALLKERDDLNQVNISFLFRIHNFIPKVILKLDNCRFCPKGNLI